MKTREKIIEELQGLGNRVTRARLEVIEYVLSRKEPTSIQEIVAAVSADEVSVYRTIALLKELNLIEETSLGDGNRRFSFSNEHHHHAVCTRCGYVSHIPCDSKTTTGSQVPKDFARLTSHSVTYYGVCVACRKCTN